MVDPKKKKLNCYEIGNTLTREGMHVAVKRDRKWLLNQPQFTGRNVPLYHENQILIKNFLLFCSFHESLFCITQEFKGSRTNFFRKFGFANFIPYFQNLNNFFFRFDSEWENCILSFWSLSHKLIAVFILTEIDAYGQVLFRK